MKNSTDQGSGNKLLASFIAPVTESEKGMVGKNVVHHYWICETDPEDGKPVGEPLSICSPVFMRLFDLGKARLKKLQQMSRQKSSSIEQRMGEIAEQKDVSRAKKEQTIDTETKYGLRPPELVIEMTATNSAGEDKTMEGRFNSPSPRPGVLYQGDRFEDVVNLQGAEDFGGCVDINEKVLIDAVTEVTDIIDDDTTYGMGSAKQVLEKSDTESVGKRTTMGGALHPPSPPSENDGEDVVVANVDEENKLRGHWMGAVAEEQKVASSPYPSIEEEKTIVQEAIYGEGPSKEVVARSGADWVLRGSIQTLQPGQWLNDEVINYFFRMLSQRDQQLCQGDSFRRRCHFFNSFFMIKVVVRNLSKKPAQEIFEDTYDYKNVQRWSRRVPGKDLFALDKIFFPINDGGQHWVCVVAFMQERRIQMYDSLGGGGEYYLSVVFRYIKDEHRDKKGTALPHARAWNLVPCERNTPSQQNSESPLWRNQKKTCGIYLTFVHYLLLHSQVMTAASSPACSLIFFLSIALCHLARNTPMNIANK